MCAHADSLFAGWQVGNATSIYSAYESPSSLLAVTFQEDESAAASHGDHAVVESFGGALVRTEGCMFDIGNGVHPQHPCYAFEIHNCWF